MDDEPVGKAVVAKRFYMKVPLPISMVAPLHAEIPIGHPPQPRVVHRAPIALASNVGVKEFSPPWHGRLVAVPRLSKPPPRGGLFHAGLLLIHDYFSSL